MSEKNKSFQSFNASSYLSTLSQTSDLRPKNPSPPKDNVPKQGRILKGNIIPKRQACYAWAYQDQRQDVAWTFKRDARGVLHNATLCDEHAA